MELGPQQKQWIEALKSGNFNQCFCTLYQKNTDSYCCLGVANKVLELKENSNVSLVWTYDNLGLNTSNGTPDIKISDSLNEQFEMEFGILPECLTELNDSYRFNFEKIAYILEKYPELYFNRSV